MCGGSGGAEVGSCGADLGCGCGCGGFWLVEAGGPVREIVPVPGKAGVGVSGEASGGEGESDFIVSGGWRGSWEPGGWDEGDGWCVGVKRADRLLEGGGVVGGGVVIFCDGEM